MSSGRARASDCWVPGPLSQEAAQVLLASVAAQAVHVPRAASAKPVQLAQLAQLAQHVQHVQHGQHGHSVPWMAKRVKTAAARQINHTISAVLPISTGSLGSVD